MGFILFIVSLVLVGIVFAISTVVTPIYYICTFKWKTGLKKLDKWFMTMAISVDQFGNIACGKVLQMFLTKKNGHPFNDEDDTVSYVLGRNEYKNRLTKFGKFIVNVLDFVDKNHCTNAIFKKIESDQEAVVRMNEDKYFK